MSSIEQKSNIVSSNNVRSNHVSAMKLWRDLALFIQTEGTGNIHRENAVACRKLLLYSTFS